ncbi:MAG: hypothetical protein GXP32_02410, partial [Kiritimatiellaeota bacterium]|nr:hypothetical protein [Kiritimatiellota bacterium]
MSGLGSDDFDAFKRRMISGELTDCAKLCVATKDFVVIEEREECSSCVLREFHWKDDRLIHGTLVLPLIVKDEFLGLFAASIPVSEVKDPEITSLFSEVVRDITQAIEKIQNEKELDRLRLERIKTGKLESLGVMAGGIAHDFNNVLVGILGNISLAKLEIKKDDHLMSYLDSAENAARKARELTHRLLTFSKGGTQIKSPMSIIK